MTQQTIHAICRIRPRSTGVLEDRVAITAVAPADADSHTICVAVERAAQNLYGPLIECGVWEFTREEIEAR